MRCSPAVGAAAEPGRCGVHGLVALGVGQRRGDVGRQRHLADRGERRERVVGARARRSACRRPRCGDRRRGTAARPAPSSGSPVAGWRAGRTRPPSARCSSSSGSSSSTSTAPPVCPAQVEPGRDDPGVVDDEQVAGVEQLGQVAHVAVRRRLGPAPRSTSSRAASRGSIGVWAMALRRQVVVEVRRAARRSRLRPAPSPVTCSDDGRDDAAHADHSHRPGRRRRRRVRPPRLAPGVRARARACC